MKIKQTFKQDESASKIISVERFIELTEQRGHYKKDTALETLKQCGKIQTPYAYYELM